MAKEKYLKEEQLPAWLSELGRTNRVLAPREEGGSIVFRPCADGEVPVLATDSTASPKAAIFPASHELFSFAQEKNPDDPEKASLTLTPKIEAEPTVVFGARPCGVRGFLIFDRVYQGEKFPDPYYKAAREKTLFITQTCTSTENTCFCNWVGSGPDDPAGSDVLLTRVNGGFLLEAVSGRGEALLESPLLSDAGDRAKEAKAAREEARKSLGEARDLSAAPKSLLALFNDQGFWEDVSAKCLSCGACTYLCPTCYCFSITDETKGLSGKRLRSWDNCMSFQFTLEASGHNPRPTKAHRLKNRVGHKFSYYPTLHEGLLACCGCGRCIKSCPVSVDIREIVLRAIEHAKAQEVSE
ncbi:MAG: 4Fe-4S dicluster domain-containing protein [Syntrophobacteraceae bacterium]|nr:4Fe-4S dicluster domain-containing protein [Desulfobacteraceae bacterium]